MANSQHLVVLCTCPDQAVAERIAKAAVEERMAACVNILPELTSVYRWEGSLQCDVERLMIIKTRTEAFPALERRIRSLHPYDVPEVIGIPIEAGSEAYLSWIGGTVGGAR